MNNFKIIKLKIDEHEFVFRSGLNFILGKNGSGKTTIVNCIKYTLGISSDLRQYMFQKTELVVGIGESNFTFSREAGRAQLQVTCTDNIFTFRARSKELDEFFLRIFIPKFATGEKLVSVFPLLDFCFIAEEAPLNAKSLWNAMRLICGANDKLVTTVRSDIEELHSQIFAEEKFIERNDVFIKDFSSGLPNFSTEIERSITDALNGARFKLLDSVEEKRKLLFFSNQRLEELKRENEIYSLNILHDIENEFLYLLEEFPFFRNKQVKIKDVILRNIDSASYGETTLANFLVLMAVARAAINLNVNFANFYISDGFISRSLDDYSRKHIHNLLNIQSQSNNDFQYIEFTSNSNIPAGFIAGDLSDKRWQA